MTVGGLVICFAGFEAASRGLDAAGIDSELTGHGAKWLVPAAVFAWVVLVEGRTLESVGLRLMGGPLVTAGWVLAGTAVMLAANVVCQPLWQLLPGGDEAVAEGLGSFADLSGGERAFVAATAGATEEPPYRSYPIERIGALTGSPLLGGAVAGVAFLVAHLGETWTPAAVVRMAQPTALLIGFYLLTGSLPVVVGMHALNDAVGLAMAERFAE